MIDETSVAAPGEWLDVRITHRQAVADGISQFVLQTLDGAALPAFTAGAHIDVALPNGAIRQYSLCNDPAERDRYELGILLEPEGRGGSRSAHESLVVGSRLRIGRPRNLFPLLPARHSILLAGGIGITPILAMAAQLTREDRSFELHYCGRSAGRMAFRDRLVASAYASCVHVHTDDGPAEQRFDAMRMLPAPDADLHAYICGPRGFMDHVTAALAAKGWAAENVHFECFSAPEADPATAAEFEVQVGVDGPVVPVPAGHSVAEALKQAGIEIPLSCEQGICGTCAVRVLDGTPDHRDMFFTEAEKAANDRFTPCCSRAHSPRLVIAIEPPA